MRHFLYFLTGLLILVTACKKDRQEGGKLSLQVKGFWPNSGNAGTIVTVSGTGFGAKAADNEVKFNGKAATIVDVRDTVLIVLAPAGGSSGAITVEARGQKADVGAYTYQALSLHGISPTNGPAGTNVSIRGAGFSSITAPVKVTINGKEAVVTNITDTLLVVAVPDAAGSGVVAVMVDGKTVKGPDFSFQNISGINPVKGGKGTQVTITGEGFSTVAANNLIAFNGKSATVVSAGVNQLVVTVPDGVSTGAVTVIVNGQKTVGSVFTVVPPPVLKTIAPLSGPAGADITITGSYFSSIAGEVSVLFNGKPASIETMADNKLAVKVPAGAGTGTILVLVNGQQTVGPEFKEQNLGIAQLVPDNGLAGSQITIKGIGFSTVASDNKVDFNGIAATVISASETELTVTAPAGVTTGVVNVSVNSLGATGPLFKRAGVLTVAGGPTKNDFNFIGGLAVDKQGNVYATDGNLIKKATPAGVLSIFAGQSASGNVNGNGANALFNYVTGLTIDGNDNLYVCDRFNKQIRKITPAGDVSTFAVLTFQPMGIAIDGTGALYVGAEYNGVYGLNANGIATRLSSQAYETAAYICIDAAGMVYYAADYNYNTIFRVAGGVKTTYAGSGYGFTDGPVGTALFIQPLGLAIDGASGNMYTTDINAIRVIADGVVTTATGTQGGAPAAGYVDGAFSEALFRNITAICLDKDGNLYVAERDNKAIRKVFFR